jgi:transcriptional regulator with XRE-family HTH domain
MKTTSDAIEILNKTVKDDPEFQKMIIEERLHLKIADLVYETREKAGLTQKQLAILVGTSQPAIARIEDANYKGHSLNVLARIAQVLGYDLEISLKKRDAVKEQEESQSEHILEAV